MQIGIGTGKFDLRRRNRACAQGNFIFTEEKSAGTGSYSSVRVGRKEAAALKKAAVL